MITGHTDSDFLKGMPGPGQTVSIYPSNTVRDLFYANGGRISKDAMTNAIGRLTFTYGWDIANAWMFLVDEGYVVSDGDDWVWSMVIPGYVNQTRYVCT